MKAPKPPATPRTRTTRGPSLTMKRIVTEIPKLIAVADRMLAQMRGECMLATGSNDITPLIYLITQMAERRPAERRPEVDAQGDIVTDQKMEA